LAQHSENIPKPLSLPAGKSVQSYPLAPVDGFVLSRIDGTLSIREIVTLTGLDNVTVQGSIDKLVSLGLVSLGAPLTAPRSVTPPPGAIQTRSPSIPARPVTEVSGVLDSGIPKPPPALYDPAELDEAVELDRDHRRKILDAYYRISELDLYQVLAVDRKADKKAIKHAYYDLAAVHHPDRFFRKQLGSFKQKMEAVFSRVTEAHDTLVDKSRRAEYDAYLAAQDEARALEAQLTRRASSPGMDRTDHAAREAAKTPAPIITSPPPVVPTTPMPERTSGIQLSDQARRDALARRLLGGRPSPAPAPQTPSAQPLPMPDPDALRRHYEQKISAVREHMSREHIGTADAAAAAGDWVAASNAYRLALQVNPDDERLQRALAEVQTKANAVLAEAYRKQASYEEKSMKYAEAARSWQRVTKALPEDAGAHYRAAWCLMKDGSEPEKNLRIAATLAQRAVTLEPKRVDYRTTLAEIYLAAGLSLNARRELEAAARLAPDDANIEALLKRAGKG
jgi:curved DNA-binding protein CbpA